MPRIRIVRATIPDAAAMAAEFSSPSWDAAARVLKRDAASRVLAGRCADGAPVVVKVLLLRGAGGALRRLLGLTRGLRQLHGAALLQSRGLAAAMPMAVWRSSGPDGTEERLVMALVEGAALIDLYGSNEVNLRDQHALARACGRLVAAMCKAGLRNRDLKASNVIARRTPDSGWELVQIDTVGVRDSASFDDAPEMLFRLVVEGIGLKSMPRRSLLYRAVMGAVDVLPPESRRARAKQVWRQVGEIARRHGDARPRVDPRACATMLGVFDERRV